jgi:hypothetical protein
MLLVFSVVYVMNILFYISSGQGVPISMMVLVSVVRCDVGCRRTTGDNEEVACAVQFYQLTSPVNGEEFR